MKQIEEKKTKVFRSDIPDTGISVEYRATYTTGAEQESVATVYVSASKSGKPVASAGYDRAKDRLHVSFEPFTGMTPEEREAVGQTVLSDLSGILNG